MILNVDVESNEVKEVDGSPPEWRQDSDEMIAGLHKWSWALRNAAEGAPDLFETEFRQRCEQLPTDASNELDQWIE